MELEINGQKNNFYVVSQDWCKDSIKVEGGSVTIINGGNFNIARVERQDFAPDMYEDFKLLGSQLEYTVDMSNVPCSCNAALYFLKMPGYDASQNPAPSAGGNYYCDAMKVGGYYCPDMDVAEANKYATAITAHKCDTPEGKFYKECDVVGCGKNSYENNPKAMCPSDDCTINTNSPYRHIIKFLEGTDGVLAKIENTFEQNGKSYTFTSCKDAKYLDLFSEDTRNLVMTVSLWGNDHKTMEWLDGMTGCKGDCPNEKSVTFSDFKFTTLNEKVEIE